MAKPENIASHITGVVLAGGRATRMGGVDKGLLQLAGRPMVEYVIEAFKSQVNNIIINANRNQEVYAAYGYPVISDLLGGFCGPLAGIASAMQYAHTPYIVTAPCDSPFVPGNLTQKLYHAMTTDQVEISVAHNGERLQPVFALLKCELLPSLLSYLNAGERKIDSWYARHTLAIVDFSDQSDAFININTAEEIKTIERKVLEAV
jgi:molybdenum cofactor guanylyltransferase